jgi:serine/threonine protein kinase
MLSQNIQTGATLLDRYEVLDRLGEGGFGVVYKARQISTGQLVAVKVLLSDRLMDEAALGEEIQRFQREMELIGMFSHPNVVKLIDSGVSDSKRFMVLEYIEGRELNDFLKKNGPMLPTIAKRVVSQVLDALSSAHAKGIIHRDLKPQNIMLTGPDGRPNVKILDFGIAGISKEHRSDDYKTLTQAGQIRGTPSYMAPEQIRFGSTSPQSDIYAVGLILLECLTGRRAVTGDSLQDICIKQVLEPLSMNEDILYSPFGPVISRACAKDLNERYGNNGNEARAAEEMMTDLEHMELTGMARLDTGELTNSGNIKTGAFGQSIASRSIAARPPSLAMTTKSGPLGQQQDIASISASQMLMPGVEQRPANKTPLIIALVLLAMGGVGAAVFFAMRGGNDTPLAAAADQPANNDNGNNGGNNANSGNGNGNNANSGNNGGNNGGNNANSGNGNNGGNNANNGNGATPLAATNPTSNPPADPQPTTKTPDPTPPAAPALYSARSRRVSINALESLMSGTVQGGRGSDPAVLSLWHITANVTAKVFNGDKVLCEATPCQVLLPRPDAPLKVELKANDHRNTELTLAPAGGEAMVATLTRTPAPAKRPPKTDGGKTDGGKTDGGKTGDGKTGDGKTGDGKRIGSFDD